MSYCSRDSAKKRHGTHRITISLPPSYTSAPSTSGPHSSKKCESNCATCAAPLMGCAALAAAFGCPYGACGVSPAGRRGTPARSKLSAPSIPGSASCRFNVPAVSAQGKHEHRGMVR
eukprot:351773-Chlamydomonas_euryale.AAC.6